MARSQPYWIAGLLSALVWGYSSTRFRTIREPLFLGFLFFTAGIVGLCTIQPGDSFSQLAFCALAGFGFGAPLILIITGELGATLWSDFVFDCVLSYLRKARINN